MAHVITLKKEKIVRKNLLSTEFSRMFFKNKKKTIGKLKVYGSGSSAHGFLLQLDGALFGFGYNAEYQLGLSDTINRSHLEEINFFSKKNIVHISCGWKHSMILCKTCKENKLFCSGNHPAIAPFYGKNNERVPQLVDLFQHWEKKEIKGNIMIKVLDIFAGLYHTVILSESLDVYSLGRNSDGQLGTGDFIDRGKITRVVLSEKVLSVSCGGEFTYFISLVGNIFVCGRNKYGQLGLGFNSEKKICVPKQLLFFKNGNIDILQVECGTSQTLFLTTENLVFGTGKNSDGRLSIGNNKDHYTPSIVFSLRNEKVIVVKSAVHSLFMSRDKIWVGGRNNEGQLGKVDYIDENLPLLFSIKGKKIIHTLLLNCSTICFTSKNEIYGCGENNVGQLFCGKSEDGKTSKVIKICNFKAKRNKEKPTEIYERFEFLKFQIVEQEKFEITL